MTQQFEGNSLGGLASRLRGAFYHRNDAKGTLDYVPHYQRTVYAADTVTTYDGLLMVRCTTANITITLPDASAATGHIVTIKKIDPTSYTVTVDADGGDEIDGLGGVTLVRQYTRMAIMSTGVGWQIVTSEGVFTPVAFADSGALWALIWFGAGNGYTGRQRAQVRALSRGQLYLHGQTFAGR